MPEKPSASKLKSILEKAKYLTPGFGLPMLARDVASRVSLNRMAKNLDPYNYSQFAPGKTAAERFAEAVILNKPEEPRVAQEQMIEKGYGMYPGPEFEERVDLLQMLAGKPQKYKTIEKSQYRPKVGAEEGSQYYSSKGIEKSIIAELGLDKKNVMWQKDLIDPVMSKAALKDGKPMVGKGGVVAVIPGLGGATYGIGRDKKGIYLSYGDVWDLNPTAGIYSDEAKASQNTLEKLKEQGIQGVKKAVSYVVNAKATPAKVYGRIYFDPKTGKPIQ